MKKTKVVLPLILILLTAQISFAQNDAQFFEPAGCNIEFYKNLDACKETTCTTMVKSSKADAHMQSKDSILGETPDGRCHTTIEYNGIDPKTGKANKKECYFRGVSVDSIIEAFKTNPDPSVTNLTWTLMAAQMKQAMVIPPTATSQSLQEDCNPKKWSKYSPNEKGNSNSKELCVGLKEAVENCEQYTCTKNGVSVSIEGFNKRNRCIVEIDYKKDVTTCKVKEETLSMLANQINFVFLKPDLINTFEIYNCK